MKNYFVEYKPSALEDLSRIRAYIAEDSPEQAERLIDLLEGRSQSLSDFPELGKPYNKNYRFLVVSHGYKIYYRIDAPNQRVTILHFFSPYQNIAEEI